MFELFLEHCSLMQSMNFFDIVFCRENGADLALAKMIIDDALYHRLYNIEYPESGFINLNNQYWYKFNTESILKRYKLFKKDKLIKLILELIDRKLYKVIGSIIEDNEILILLENDS